jgi:hypothetical protein
MSKERTVIHKVPIHSIEGILGLKDESPTAQNKLSETVIQKPASAESKVESLSAVPSPDLDKLSGNGKLVKLHRYTVTNYNYCCCCCYTV